MVQTLTTKSCGLHMKPDFFLSFLKKTDFFLNYRWSQWRLLFDKDNLSSLITSFQLKE